ncbi:MAG: hypothetical protein P9F75_17415 [Candidatus Contendobacter sp.]|nr:hypothetical protein [Candidatus Contendobacter sp.]
MTSCKEARFYLNTWCGVHSLDGNHNGVPCETLCHLVLIVNLREGTRWRELNISSSASCCDAGSQPQDGQDAFAEIPAGQRQDG